MGWFRRLREALAPPADPEEPQAEAPATTEQASPGIAALFEGLKEDRGHAVLDLGLAADTHLRLFRKYARAVRFAGLTPEPPAGTGWNAAIRALPPHPDHPYDVVLAWNVLDRLSDRERRHLVGRLDEITGPGARLHLFVDASGEAATPAVRFTLLDLDRVSREVVGPPERGGGSQLLPAQVERLLAPFEVVRAFTLRHGLREYVAVKGGEEAYTGRTVRRG